MTCARVQIENFRRSGSITGIPPRHQREAGLAASPPVPRPVTSPNPRGKDKVVALLVLHLSFAWGTWVQGCRMPDAACACTDHPLAPTRPVRVVGAASASAAWAARSTDAQPEDKAAEEHPAMGAGSSEGKRAQDQTHCTNLALSRRRGPG